MPGLPGRCRLSLLLRRRDFGLLWIGGLVSFTGDWAMFAGLPLAVYGLTDSTLATGGIFAAAMAPRILLGSFAGVLVDRWDRRRTIVSANLAQAVGALPLLAVDSAGLVWIVYAVAALQSSLSLLVGPAESALLPTLVAKDELVAANALNSLNNNLARLVGPALGGYVVAFTGLGGVVVLDAASFLGAAGLVALIRARPQDTSVDVETPSGLGREWLDGLRLIRRTRVAAVLVSVAALTGLGEGVIITLLVPFVTDVLEGGEIAYGVILSAQAVGGLLGGVLIARYAAPASPSRLLGVGAVGIGLIDVAIFTYPFFVGGIELALVLMVIVGLPVAAYGAGLGTLLQTALEDRYRGRLVGAFETTFALTLLVGTGLAGVLGDVLGVLPMLYVQSAVYTLAGVVVLVVLLRPGAGEAAPES